MKKANSQRWFGEDFGFEFKCCLKKFNMVLWYSFSNTTGNKDLLSCRHRQTEYYQQMQHVDNGW